VIRFIVTEPIHTCLNLIFDMGDVFTTNYSFNNMRHPHPRQLQTTIVTDFVNIKIKSIQSFRAAHFGRDVRACVNRGEYSCMYAFLRLSIPHFKKIFQLQKLAKVFKELSL
jgi:hypothetical protein